MKNLKMDKQFQPPAKQDEQAQAVEQEEALPSSERRPNGSSSNENLVREGAHGVAVGGLIGGGAGAAVGGVFGLISGALGEGKKKSRY